MGIQKGTIILRTTHIRVWGLGLDWDSMEIMEKQNGNYYSIIR